MSRRGFTLTELLVATIVFMIGFVSVFALFLGGMRMRKLAEDTTRSSLAASCLIDEIRIDAGAGGGGIPMAPNEYEGDGFAPFRKLTGGGYTGVPEGYQSDNPPPPPNPPPNPPTNPLLDNPLFAYRPIPGTWYRVIKCTDLENTQNSQTTVLKLDLLVVPFSTADSTLTFNELNRRLSLFSLTERDVTIDTLSTRLVQRGLGFRFVAVVTRRPSWLP
jgi:prepilin-type N-terminal cleavage/methylation domain-containing protein